MKKRHAGPVDFECYGPVVKHFSEVCHKLHANEPALNHLYKLANLCRLGTTTERIMEAVRANCA